MQLSKIKETTSISSLNAKEKVSQKLKIVSPELRLFALKLVGRNQLSTAKDLYQETALAAITHADKYRYDSNFKGWTMTIMRNIFINNYRKKKRFGNIAEIDADYFKVTPKKMWIKNNADANVGYKELTTMINSLPETLRRPLWMVYEGYKYYEIAEALDAPIGTIKSRIFHARQQVVKLYEVQYSF